MKHEINMKPGFKVRTIGIGYTDVCFVLVCNFVNSGKVYNMIYNDSDIDLIKVNRTYHDIGVWKPKGSPSLLKQN